jgi:hypothetical protein
MTAKYIWESGSIILVILGSIHLYYTFFTNKFSSKNLKLVEEMKSSFPILTNKTTMWKAWIGFNASHSSGAIFIGLINFYLAAKYFPVFHLDHVFFLFNILTIGFYLGVAKKYWFGIPFIGILIVLTCFILSYILNFSD